MGRPVAMLMAMVWLGPIFLLSAGLVVIVLILTVGAVRVLGQPKRRSAGWAAAHHRPLDPTDAKLPHEIRRVETPAGPQEIWLIQGQDENGPRVVVVHGWGDGRVGALAWAPILLPICRQIVLFDLHGHGDSPQPKCDWGPVQTAAVGAICQSLNDRTPTVLLGLSWGGRLAVTTAQAFGMVHGVVMDCTGRIAKNAPREGMRQMGLPPWPAMDLAMAWAGGNMAGDLCDEVSNLSVPLLAIAGQNDPIAPPADAEAIAQAAPNGRYKIFPNAGHLEPACADPDGYREAMVEFFNSLPLLRK